MPHNTYGYDSYRGRTRARKILTAILVILVVLLVLAVAAFFFLQRFLVYTDDGQARLELPFLRQEEQVEPAAESTPAGPTGEDVIMVTPTPGPEPTETPAPILEPQPVTNAVWLKRAHLTEGSWKSEMTRAGADAVLFNLKADDGTLGYVSALPAAARLQTTETNTALNTRLTALTAADTPYVIARVSCFKDNIAPRSDPNLAIKTTAGYNWRDGEERRWLSVASANARAYAVGVIQELAAMGVDEILLENSGWPTTGDLSAIRTGEGYDPDALSAPVEQFYQELRQALEGTGIKLSVSVSPQVLTGAGDLSGVTPQLLGQYADRVYVSPPAGEGDYAPGLAAAGLTADRLVYIVPKGTPASETVSQLIQW